MSRIQRVIDALVGPSPAAPSQAITVETKPTSPYRRADGWTNQLTGYGTARDKVAQGYFDWSYLLTPGELEALFYNDDIANKIVSKLPFEMFRRGYVFEGDGADDVKAASKTHGIDKKLRLAITWARLYGGAAVVLGINDGQTQDKPVNAERIRTIAFANVLDRRFILPIRWYQDPTQAKYGEPELYQIVSPIGSGLQGSVVHESRLIRFDGTEVDIINRQRLGGWSYSALQRVYDAIQKFAMSFSAASQLAIDAGQAVFSIKGWIDTLSQDAGAAIARMAEVDSQRSSGRAVVLDADNENFRREGVQLSGLSDLLDRFMLRVAAAADMPVAVLFGRSPAGLNATGESDLTQWYDFVAAHQADTLKPALEQWATFATAGKWKGEIEFLDMKEPDDAVAATVAKTKAETTQIYVDMGALMPEQVALHEFLDVALDDEIIDETALRKAIKDGYKDPPATTTLPPSDPVAMMAVGGPPKALPTPPPLPPKKLPPPKV